MLDQIEYQNEKKRLIHMFSMRICISDEKYSDDISEYFLGVSRELPISGRTKTPIEFSTYSYHLSKYQWKTAGFLFKNIWNFSSDKSWKEHEIPGQFYFAMKYSSQ